jgi:hypothetical protein
MVAHELVLAGEAEWVPPQPEQEPLFEERP